MRRAEHSQRRGAVAALVVLSLGAVLFVVAMTVDGGLLLAKRRQTQAAADASALAAAADLFKNWNKNLGKDLQGTAKSNALAIAAGNGFSNDGKTSTVEV